MPNIVSHKKWSNGPKLVQNAAVFTIHSMHRVNFSFIKDKAKNKRGRKRQKERKEQKKNQNPED